MSSLAVTGVLQLEGSSSPSGCPDDFTSKTLLGPTASLTPARLPHAEIDRHFFSPVFHTIHFKPYQCFFFPAKTKNRCETRNTALFVFPVRRRRSREQCLLCEGLRSPLCFPNPPPFSPFLFPSHSLLSDVDWIGLETGRCGEQRRRWWKWQCVCRVWILRCAFDAFARQTRAYISCGEEKRRERRRKKERDL